ncbi:MAG: pyrroline-5-carboxylate reductase [Bacteroidaceae bacterium]|nr:pyrroline-5-carboxylate reductase [Bacteroidaceae bacterium]
MKVAIIGAGNMGGATARGLAQSKHVDAKDIFISNPSKGKLDAIKAEFPEINVTQDNKECVKEADMVILAVKPWKIEDVAWEIATHLKNGNVILGSMAAGTSTEKIENLFGQHPIYIIIPNTAIAVRQSMTFIARKNTTPQMDSDILTIFKELGEAMIIEERQMGAGMALASCGIAYAMRYIRAAMEGGVELGMYAKDAQHIVEQTLLGAVELLRANNSHPEEEIDRVTTPGGITIRGLNAMEENGFTNSVIKGLKASK